MRRLLLAAVCVSALWACARNEPASASSASASALAPMNPRTPAEAPPRHVLLTIEIGSAGMKVLGSTAVDAPLPIDRTPERAPWRIRVEDASGGTLYVGAVEAAGVLRGEFAGPGGKIEAVHLAKDPAVLPVRIPALPGAKTLRLFAKPESVPDDARAKSAPPGELVELGHAAYPAPAP